MNRYMQTLTLKRRKKSSFRGYNVGKFPPPGKIRHCHKCPFASFQEQNISRNRCKYLRWTNKRLRPLLCGGKRLSLPLLVNSIPLVAFIAKAPIYGCIYRGSDEIIGRWRRKHPYTGASSPDRKVFPHPYTGACSLPFTPCKRNKPP